jgi:hypothetical protein
VAVRRIRNICCLDKDWIIPSSHEIIRIFLNTVLSSLNFPLHYPQFGRAKDPVKFLQAVEQRARERQVAYETVRLLRQDVITCFRKEGVNHYENCKEETEKYYKVIIKKDVGQLQPNWENKEKNEGW